MTPQNRITDGQFAPQVLGWLAEHVAAFVLQLMNQLRSRRNASRAVLVVFAAACTLAVSQTSSPSAAATAPQVQTSTSSSYSFSRDSVLQNISNAVQSQLNALASNTQLKSFGTLLTGFFLVAMLVWSSVKTMASGKGLAELIGEWVPIFVGFGIVNLFLDQDAAKQIVSMMDSIGAAIGGQNMSTLDSAIRACAEPIFKAIAAVLDQPRVTAATSISSNPMTWLGSLGASLGSMLFGVIADLVVCFVLIAAGVVMVAHVIMGFISVQLVLLLAPVMVPFLMFRPLEWVFSGWLKFLVGACMLKIVVAVLLNFAAGMLSAMSGLAMQYYNEAKNLTPTETLTTDVLLLGLTTVFAILAALLLHQAPHISSGLLSGHASHVGFGGLGAVRQSMGNQVGVGGTSSAAAGAGSYGLQKWRNWRSSVAGKNDAEAGRPSSLQYRDPRAKAAYATSYRSNQPAKPPQPPSPGAP